MTTIKNTESNLDVVIPVHNEADSIGRVIEEIDLKVLRRFPARLIVREDGSSDATPQILSELRLRFNFVLASSPKRKGYLRAVREGMLATDADYVLCLDSDGQCDPDELAKLWERRDPGTVVVGRRLIRRDALVRRVCSRIFYAIFRLLFTDRLKDPSCPMVLIPRAVVDRVVPAMSLMNEGFWWEFSARTYLAGIPVREVGVNHRPRFSGQTSIYRPGVMPGIFFRHLRALLAIRISG